jgi:hypothetical protein
MKSNYLAIIACLPLIALFLAPTIKPATGAELEKEFVHPPDSARPWVYWWWINGNGSREGITRDFEEFKRQGIGGAVLFDAGEAKTNDVPKGPPFMSVEWRELFKHAVREADRLGIVLTVNLCSGWDAGGPWVTPELACKKLVSAQAFVKGPGRREECRPCSAQWPRPRHRLDRAVAGGDHRRCERQSERVGKPTMSTTAFKTILR